MTVQENTRARPARNPSKGVSIADVTHGGTLKSGHIRAATATAATAEEILLHDMRKHFMSINIHHQTAHLSTPLELRQLEDVLHPLYNLQEQPGPMSRLHYSHALG